jgi:hypothetical protein
MSALRRGAVLAAPAVVPASMAVLFHGLSRRLSPRAAYNVGFTSYWLVWCMDSRYGFLDRGERRGCSSGAGSPRSDRLVRSYCGSIPPRPLISSSDNEE